MQLIVITRPECFAGEAAELTRLFAAGLELLHLRKPGGQRGELEALVRAVPVEYRRRIVLHEHPSLVAEYGLRGLHLNRRTPHVPADFRGTVSRSCHSLEEVVRYRRECHYLFLSPIYDSISKEGYGAAFPKEVLRRAAAEGIIDRRVFALGGVTAGRIPELRALGFGGAALLGDIWQREPGEREVYLRELLALCAAGGQRP